MTGQLVLLDASEGPLSLPTAKVKKADRVGVHAWTNFHAAFSERFVDHAIKAFKISSEHTLLDPFVGSGTTLIGAIKAGVRVIGVDLDPFACLLARAKVATKADKKAVAAILKPASRPQKLEDFDPGAFSVFDSSCLNYAKVVFTRIYKRTGSDRGAILRTLLADKAGAFDAEVVALTALCIGAADSANVIRGSNPTWYRKAIEGEKDTFEALYSATEATARKMLVDLGGLNNQAHSRDITVINTNISSLRGDVKAGSVDFVITSPPYLTRLDYVVNHLPNLLILTGLIDVDVESLRAQMIGTPKIIEKGAFEDCWGTTCVQALERIKAHESYASERYYVWTYYQYFKSLFDSLIVISEKLKSGGKGLFVVQDSFYKEVHVDLGAIVIEMFTSLGLYAERVRRDEVVFNMKYLNPAHSKGKRSSEEIILFRKKG